MVPTVHVHSAKAYILVWRREFRRLRRLVEVLDPSVPDLLSEQPLGDRHKRWVARERRKHASGRRDLWHSEVYAWAINVLE